MNRICGNILWFMSDNRKPYIQCSLLLWFAVTALIGFVLASCYYEMNAHRKALERVACQKRVAAIRVGLWGYTLEHGAPPPSQLAFERSEFMHSWRVALLPYMGYESIYEKYNFDEPWNSPSNSALAPHIASIYRCDSSEPGHADLSTHFICVRSSQVDDDDARYTAWVVESQDTGIHCLEPRDFRPEDISLIVNDGRPPSISTSRTDSPYIIMMDGSYFALPVSTPANIVRALLTGKRNIEEERVIDAIHKR